MTTACDIMWAGVPLITSPGLKMVSRLSASLLSSLGAPYLIARSMEEYSALASSLAQRAGSNHPAYAAMRDAVGEARTASPLFDMKERARNLVSGLVISWELYRARRRGEGSTAWRRHVIVRGRGS